MAIPAPWADLVIYDTPGVNDATSLAESVIFELMDQVDVVVMLLRAQQALTATEAAFLGELVRHKDLDKFFFNINFSDSQDPEQGGALRDHVATTLGELRNWPIRSLRERVFLCSARRTLDAALGGADGDAGAHLNEHAALLAAVHAFATARRQALLDEAAEGLLRAVAQAAADKLAVALEAVQAQDAAQGRAILAITEAITGFRVAIREDELALRQRLVQRKAALLAEVAEALTGIEAMLGEWAATASLEDLAGDLLLRVLCVGDFSTGKSSFINRFLLGQDLLPAWATPTTALPTSIRCGEQTRAIRVRAATLDGTEPEQEEVTGNVAETLRAWVSTAGKGQAQDATLQFIVETPAPALAAGVEVVDSPGLCDPDAARMKLTLDSLHQADGVLFFIQATKPWTREVLAGRIKRFNQTVAGYCGKLDARLDALGLDAKGGSLRRAQLEQEVADYEEQRKTFLAGLQRLLALEFEDYRARLQRLLEGMEADVSALAQEALTKRSTEEVNAFLAQRISRLQLQTSRRLGDLDAGFLERLKTTIEAQKASIGVLPTNAVTIEEYVLRWHGLDGNPLADGAPLVGGVGLAGLLVGAGTLWQTATVTAATPGLLASVGAFFTGAPAAAASSFLVVGVPALAIGGLLSWSAVARPCTR